MDKQAEIIIYGAYWCPDCRRAKQFLSENQIAYKWVDIEQDHQGEEVVLEKNIGKRIIPTIIFADGSHLAEPSNAELAQKLDLKTSAEKSHYQLIVVGGGPAGLTAALYSAREGVDTLVIERAALGGQAAATQWLDNVPGFADGIEGNKFANQLRQQADRFGVEMLQAQDVVELHSDEMCHHIRTADGSHYSAHAILITTGSRYKHLGVDGEGEFIGAGIHFCATCDGPFYKGKHVVVIGGGNSAAEESIFLLNHVEKVTLLVRGDKLKASQILIDKVEGMEEIEVRYHTEATGFKGKGGKLDTLLIENRETGEKDELHPAGVFVFIGQEPNSSFLDGSGIHLNKWGFIPTGHSLVHDGIEVTGFRDSEPAFLETSVSGIYAAGDVRAGSTKQVASATGEGATAALLIREYLKTV